MKKSNKKSSILSKVYNAFAWLILILALAFVCMAAISSYTDTANGKQLFGIRMFIVQTNSMSKSAVSENEQIYFNAGDVVISTTKFDKNNLQVGDVITFVSNNKGETYGKTITHKIRSVKRTSSGALIGYETYGIYTGASDEATVQPHTIVGKYVGKIPYVGYAFSFIKTTKGFFLCVMIPSVLIIVYFSVYIGKVLGKKEVIKRLGINEEELENEE